MNLVLHAAPIIANYGIIINQLPPKVYQILRASQENGHGPFQDVLASLSAGVTRPCLHIHFMRRDPELEGGDNIVKPLPDDLVQFIDALPGTCIDRRVVSCVNCDEYEKQQREMVQRLEEQKRRQAELQQRLMQQQAKLDEHKRRQAELQQQQQAKLDEQKRRQEELRQQQVQQQQQQWAKEQEEKRQKAELEKRLREEREKAKEVERREAELKKKAEVKKEKDEQQRRALQAEVRQNQRTIHSTHRNDACILL
eukprot:1954583-Amphidinium_carterae.1